MKRCSRCKSERDTSEFYADKKSLDGLRSQCKVCARATSRKWKRANKARNAQNTRSWREVNRDRVSGHNLKQKFNMTIADYDAMYCAQASGCAICGIDREKKRLAVDHDHATGAIRALLCQACNTTLGKMHDNPDLLRLAAGYLESHASDPLSRYEKHAQRDMACGELHTSRSTSDDLG
jgi:hypothetical protein